MNTGKLIRTLNAHDGSILASGSWDNTIRLWYRPSGWNLDELIEGGCEKVRNYLIYNPNVSEEDKKLCE